MKFEISSVQREMLQRAQQWDRDFAALRRLPVMRMFWVLLCLGGVVAAPWGGSSQQAAMVPYNARPLAARAPLSPAMTESPMPTPETIAPTTPELTTAVGIAGDRNGNGQAAVLNGPTPTRESVLQAAATNQALNSFIQEHSWLAKLTGLFSSDTLANFNVSALLGWADATKVMSLLKQYQVAEMIYFSEDRGPKGGLGSLSDLRGKDGHEGYVDDAIIQAWDRQPGAQPLQGYFFSEIEQAETGQPLDRSLRSGLCAYPETPSSGHPVLLMLVDMHGPSGMPSDGGPVATGEMWHFYRADSRQVRGAVRRWPTQEEFASTFKRLEKHTPEEALAAAKDLAAQAQTDAPQYLKAEWAKKAQDARARGEKEIPEMAIKAKLIRVKPILEMYFSEHQRLPTQDEGLKEFPKLSGDFLKRDDLIDPWGTPFFYTQRVPAGVPIPVKVTEAFSAGPDRQPGTADDIYPEVELQ